MVDANAGEVVSDELWEVIRPEDIGLEPDRLGTMRLIYDVMEFSTALKPQALKYILGRTSAKFVTYLDPDVYVLQPFDDLEDHLDHFKIALTPHFVQPHPRDGMKPSEQDVLGAGVYNLGFISVRHDAIEMLDWWQERLFFDAISDPSRMLFTDQRWIDLVPGIWPTTIIRHAGWNVAYWNIHERAIQRAEGSYFSNTEPLVFFHFSGLEKRRSYFNSKHVLGNGRTTPGSIRALDELTTEYLNVLTRASNEYSSFQSYRFDTIDGYGKISPQFRRMCREITLGSKIPFNLFSAPPQDPFASQNHQFVDWALTPSKNSFPISPALLSVWMERADLQNAYPEVATGLGEGLAEWAITSAASEGALSDSAVECIAESLQEIEIRRGSSRLSDTFGVNLVGYFTTESGVGQVGRTLVDALKGSSIPFRIEPALSSLSREQATFNNPKESDLIFPVTIAALNADQIVRWKKSRESNQSQEWIIGLWNWEIDSIPEYFEASISAVDEIWVTSQFTANALARMTEKPVKVFPVPIEPTNKSNQDTQTSNKYVLFMFDYLSVFERKNPIGLVTAFKTAFPEPGEVELIIKTTNADLRSSDHHRLLAAVEDRDDIQVVDGYLSEPDLQSLFSGASAYVSLHRAEGFGLTLLEAMSLGIPTVATGYSGNLDFMSAENSLLVPYELVEIGPDASPYDPSGKWAEPDLIAAADLMKRLLTDSNLSRKLSAQARNDVHRTRSTLQTATWVDANLAPSKRWFESICETEATDRALTTGPNPPRSDFQVVGRHVLLKRIVRKLIRPFLLQIESRREIETDAVHRRLDELAKSMNSTVHQLSEFEVYQDNAEKSRFKLGHRLLEIEHNQLRLESNATGLLSSDLSTRSGKEILDIQENIRADRGRLAAIEAQLRAKPYTNPTFDEDLNDGYLMSLQSNQTDLTFDSLYRGPEELLANRLSIFQDELIPGHTIVDIGCGRGEFLSLAQESGCIGIGVETDERMVSICIEKGLDVRLGDGSEVLSTFKTSSVDIVTAFHVIEHVELPALEGLLREAYRVLKPGGVLVLESPNPHSPMALKAFWIDPTHVRPHYPESVLFQLRALGFSHSSFTFPFSPVNEDQHLWAGEYVIRAHR